MSRKLFGTDGIRGTVGQHPITPDVVLRLGHAVGRVLKAREPNPVVLIGKDTRISGYMLESALESGLNSAGVSVVLLGPVPTPAVAYLTRAQRASLGAVISASHNAYPDNGIKFFSATGAKLPDEWELAVEAMMAEAPQWVDSAHLGRARRLDDAAGRYIEFCKSTFPNELDLRGLKIVVDSAHGAAYNIAPHVFHELGAEVVSIGATPDGFNINAGFGATSPKALSQAVVEHKADLGIALDGDADRLIMVDATGRVYNGDELLYLMVRDRMATGEVAGAVGTLMTNMALEVAFKEMGVGFARAKVGDRYVLEVMQERGWILGGEGSGHLLALDKHSTGDGIVSALQVLSALKRGNQSLAECCKDLVLFPQTLINLRVQPGFDWTKNNAVVAEKELVERELGERGRVLIRASGTEPLVRVMVEAKEAELAEAMAKRIAARFEV